MSDTTVERLKAPITHTHIGGQAVLEGIMMRGKYNWAIAVRTPDGSIHSETHDLHSAAAKHEWMRKPIIRGVVALVETLALAMKAFSISASMSGETEEEQLSGKEIGLSLIMGLALAIGLFIVLPAVLTNVALVPFYGKNPAVSHPFIWNILDGMLRVLAFFLYIWAISRMGEIQRVFAYHGAEHKTIHAYEHSLPLEVPVIQKFTTKHVRCGTSFLLMVMVIAIFVFSFVPVKPIAAALGWESRLGVLTILILSRLVLMPLVAGIAYEVTVKWAGNHSENPFVKVILWPGLQLQKMTTREPEDDMVEIAIVATQLVIDREEAEEAAARGEVVSAGEPVSDPDAEAPKDVEVPCATS